MSTWNEWWPIPVEHVVVCSHSTSAEVPSSFEGARQKYPTSTWRLPRPGEGPRRDARTWLTINFQDNSDMGTWTMQRKKKNKKIKNDLISRRKKKREIQSKWTTSWQSGIPSVAGPFGVHQRGETRLRDAANHWRHPKFDYGLSNVTESSTQRSRPPAEGRRSESEVPPRSGSEE